MQAGHMTIYPLEAFIALQNLWISPVAVIPQVGRRTHLIFDFTRSGLNEASKSLAPMEEMCYGGMIQRILGKVLTANLHLGPVYLRNVDLANAYMNLWVRIKDVLFVAFLTPKKNLSNLQMVGFQLSLPMGYIDSAPYYCMATETLSNLTNEETSQKDVAISHPPIWPWLPAPADVIN